MSIGLPDERKLRHVTSFDEAVAGFMESLDQTLTFWGELLSDDKAKTVDKIRESRVISKPK